MEKKRKIVQFIHGFTTGGAEKLVMQYCQLFDKNKIEVMVLALHNHDSIFDHSLLESGIKVIYVDDIIDKKFELFPETLKKAMHRVYRKSIVKKCIKEFKPDVIHYHICLSEYVKYAKPEKGTKIFLTVHSDPKILWNSQKDRIKDKIATAWLISHYYFRFIALHKNMCKEINVLFGVDNTVVINNGVLFSEFKEKESPKVIKFHLSIPENAVVISHIGRFITAKNHKFIISVFEEFLELHPDSILVLVGTGELQNEVRELVSKKNLEKKVLFLGTRKDIPEILHMTDVLLFPSIYEGMPVTLIEAQAAETMCLVSDSVSKEVKISNLLFFKSLECPASDWAEKLNELINTDFSPKVDTANWDLERIIKELESLYEVG